MSSVSLTVTGTELLASMLAQLGERAKPAGAAALFQEAEAIMSDSKEHYCPVDLGTLKNSGHVQKPEYDGNTAIVVMGYGGAAKDYAIVQHERLDYRHSVGQAKYLELPLLAAASKLAVRLADRLRAFFGG